MIDVPKRKSHRKLQPANRWRFPPDGAAGALVLVACDDPECDAHAGQVLVGIPPAAWPT